MPVNIEDISKQLGLSVSTISKALNGYPDVSEGTRALVLEKARKLGYQPSAAARNLRRGRTDKIGLLVNHSLRYISEYLAEVIAGVALAAEKNGKNIILYTETVAQPDELIRICRSGEFDGALLVWANPEVGLLQTIENEAMPYLVFGRRVEYEFSSYVAPDNFDGAYQLTRHLIELGHQRLGFMSRPMHGPINDDRFGGYRQALQDADLSVDESLIVPTSLEPDSGYHAMNSMLDKHKPPTAVFAFYDLLAVDALRAATERGLRVPDDVAIVGFDGLRSSMIANPPITTVRQPLQEMGREAVRLLLMQIEDRDLPPQRLTYPVELLVRPSTQKT